MGARAAGGVGGEEARGVYFLLSGAAQDLVYFEGMGDLLMAPTVHAIAGHLGGPHEVVELPVSHTELPEEDLWYDFEAYWFRLAVSGVPPDFGGKGDLSS